MSDAPVTLKLSERTDGIFDLSLNSDGGLATVDGLQSLLTVSFFTDARADASEVIPPEHRRGWWGNLVTPDDFPEYGSKIWLLDQSPLIQETVNNAVTYAENAYQWLIDLDFADKVEVTGMSNGDTIFIEILIIKNNNIISKRVYDLWQNTIEEINA